jgi:hypothetical protein
MTESEPGSTPKKLPWWKRPIAWAGAIVMGASGVYLTDTIVTWAKSVPQSLGSPVAVVDLTRLHDPFSGRWGYVVAPSADPTSVLDEDAGGLGLAAWAEANAGVDVKISAWELTLEGRQDKAVELVNIVALYSDQPQGQTDKIVLDIDISAKRPTITRGDPEGQIIENFFASKKISLPKGEKNVLVLRGMSDVNHCRWRYRFDLVADGERTSITVSAPGDKPFEVTGENPNSRIYDWVVPPQFRACEGRRPKITGSEYAKLLQGGGCLAG